MISEKQLMKLKLYLAKSLKRGIRNGKKIRFKERISIS